MSFFSWHYIILIYWVAINIVTFFLYGIDKWKAKRSKWRIEESTLLWWAAFGGSIGALLGMKAWHHKTQHRKFTWGVPAILIAQIIIVLILTLCNFKTNKDMATIYDFKALSNRGKEMSLADYKGQVILIVNTASKCGFTPQYDGLEALYKKYKDQGFIILGFPCDQFANQEPGSDEQIEEFCRLNHGVTFPLMAKSDVNGANANPVFEYLKAQAPTEEYKGLKAKAAHAMLKRISKSVEKESDILWNFTKFLISKDGKTIQRFAPVAEPKDFEANIVAELAK